MRKPEFSEKLMPAIVAEELSPQFFSETVCREWILRQLHPGVVSCPFCATPVTGDQALSRFWVAEQVRCGGCGRRFRATTGTCLDPRHLSFRRIVFMLLLLADTTISDVWVALRVGIDKKAAGNWRRKIFGQIGDRRKNRWPEAGEP